MIPHLWRLERVVRRELDLDVKHAAVVGCPLGPARSVSSSVVRRRTIPVTTPCAVAGSKTAGKLCYPMIVACQRNMSSWFRGPEQNIAILWNQTHKSIFCATGSGNVT